MTPDALLKLAEALLTGGVPLALLLLAIALVAFVGKNVAEWLLAEQMRRQKRRQALIAAYVEIDLHTRHAAAFLPGVFLDAMARKIRAHESRPVPWPGKPARFRPFVVKPSDDGSPQKRIEDGLFWLHPTVIRSIRHWARNVALEDEMVRRMQTPEFEELETERKIEFLHRYTNHMQDVHRTGTEAKTAMELYAEFDVIRAINAASPRQ